MAIRYNARDEVRQVESRDFKVLEAEARKSLQGIYWFHTPGNSTYLLSGKEYCEFPSEAIANFCKTFDGTQPEYQKQY